jgi:hypothetical protein
MHADFDIRSLAFRRFRAETKPKLQPALVRLSVLNREP